MKFIWQSTKWRSDPFDSFIWQPACIPTTFLGRADSPSISTTFVGTAILTKFVGMVYFDISCQGKVERQGQGNINERLKQSNIILDLKNKTKKKQQQWGLDPNAFKLVS